MRWTKNFIPTLKETPQESESVSHQLLLKAGLIRMLISGVYTYLPLGLRVLKNIEKIIHQEMASSCAVELLLPALQPLELWIKSKRNEDIGEVMIRFSDRRGRKVCLGPTHEEVITDLVKNHLSSYKQLPLILYQIQTKFRDEIRSRFGLVRACEFIMKDAYSFDRDISGLDKNYKAMYKAYQRIFKRCGLDTIIVEADPGVMGGNLSHEFMAPAENGEDIVLLCPRCKRTCTFSEEKIPACPQCQREMQKINTLEVGHTFKLGTKYSALLEANFLDARGKLQPVVMGCYGIGVSRLISAIIEQNHDEKGIIWPKAVSPYPVIILPLDVSDKKIITLADSVYKELLAKNITPLYDDRNERSGVKFKDADLLGIPLQIIIGSHTLKKNTLELKIRRSNERMIKSKTVILDKIKKWIDRP